MASWFRVPPLHLPLPARLGLAGLLLVVMLLPAAPATRAIGTWTPVAPLITGRWGQTATALPGDQVLVVGGRHDVVQKPVGSTTVHATAERYDPVGDRWRPAATMAEERYGHTATLLPGGRVLVTGGPSGHPGASATAEIYDPAIDRWSHSAPMAAGRIFHTATLLGGGQVLVVGGDTGMGAPALSSAELYDPQADRWHPAAAMGTPRYHHTATLLRDGTVLVVGGDAGRAGATAERYYPAQDRWLPVPPMAVVRIGHTATLLLSERVLVAGGSTSDPEGTTAELYDPATNQWRRAGAMHVARQKHTATLLPDGTVLVAGRGNLTGVGYGISPVSSAERYDPIADAWLLVAPMIHARGWHTATPLSKARVLLVGEYRGGPNEAGNSAEMYTEDVTFGTYFPETGHLVRGRFLDYWRAHGGLAINGYPLSDERTEVLEDGNAYTVQYFERVRLEYHPENPPPYDVLLGQFGRRVLRDSPVGTGWAAPLPGQTHFAETGHSLGGRFRDYWQAHGGLAQFGYPLTEESVEGLLPGQPMIAVQYFERARFEYHPENAPPYAVLLGQFGRQVLEEANLLATAPAFRRLYLTNPRVQELVGRPVAAAETAPGASLGFERGLMLWRGDTRRIYVLCDGDQGAGQDFLGPLADTWDASQPAGGDPGPRPGLYEPGRGFGKLWRENAEVRACLGYATSPAEAASPVTVQPFRRSPYDNLLLAATTPEGRFIYVVYGTFPGSSSCVGRPALCRPDYERYPNPLP